MTDNTTSQSGRPENSGSENGSASRPRRGRGTLFVIGLVSAGALVGAFATKAMSHGPGFHGSWGGYHGGYERGFKRAHWRGPGFGRGMFGGKFNGKRAERMAKHLAVEIDATPEQTEKLVAIATALSEEVRPTRKEMRKTRKAVVDMLTSDEFDRAAIEKLRTDQIQRWDAASKRVLDAMADAAEVLTPEQRAELRKRVAEWREKRGRRWGRHHEPERDNDE